MNVVAPFYFRWTRSSLLQRNTLVMPLFYHGSGPAKRNLSILGLYWDFHSFHKRRTFGMLPFFIHSKDLWRKSHLTWVFPTFQYQKTPDDWRFYFHPLLYLKGGAEKTWQVFFPLWWRFSEPLRLRQVFFPLLWDFKNLRIERRITLFFPLFLRYKKGEDVHSVFLLFYHWKGREDGKRGWRLGLFPAFSFGRTEPDDYYWKILLGLVGFERRGGEQRLYLFWLPVRVG